MTPPPDPPPERRPLPQPNRGPILDQQPERQDVRHVGVDGVNQRPLKRTDTLPQMAALRAPPVTPGGTLTGLPAPAAPGSVAPPPPPLPLELAATKRPPLPWGRTVNAPAPPETVAAARRSDPPPQPATPAAGTRIERRVIETESPTSGRAEAREALLEQELTKARAELAKAKTAELEQAKRGADSIRPDGTVESLRKAQTKLLLGIAALLAGVSVPAYLWVSSVATEAKVRADRATTQVVQATNAAEDAKAGKAVNAKGQAELERAFRQYRANRRELDRLQGIEYPKVEGDPEPDQLEPYAPLCPVGKVCPGAQLILRKAP